MDFLPPGQKKVEIQIATIKPGITRIKFKNFEDMGNYYQSRIDEFESRGARIVTVGACMFVHEKKGI